MFTRACKLYVIFIKAHYINFHLAYGLFLKRSTFIELVDTSSFYVRIIIKTLLGIVFNFFFRLYSELFLSTGLKIY
jgi:hypothetical protein